MSHEPSSYLIKNRPQETAGHWHYNDAGQKEYDLETWLNSLSAYL